MQIHSLASGSFRLDHGEVLGCELFSHHTPGTAPGINVSIKSKTSNKTAMLHLSSWNVDSVKYTAIVWNLSKSEQSDLEVLGQRLKDVDHHKNVPLEVIRFLRKERGNVDAAEASFRKMIAWRLENKVDTILQWYQPPKLILQYYAGAVLQGFDRSGEPVYLERTGVIDQAGMLRKFGRKECMLHAIWMREMVVAWARNYEQTHRRKIGNLTIISDAYGLPIWQCMTNRNVISVFKDMMKLDQDYYPEGPGKIFIIRVPVLFEMLWKVIRHFFPSRDLQKMVICSCSDYKSILSEHMDLSILPESVLPAIGKGKADERWPTDFVGGTLPP
jgi:hypothetical protein